VPADSANKIQYAGYLNQASRLEQTQGKEIECLDGWGTEENQLVVCTLGGGQDGYALAKAFANSLPDSTFKGVLLTGPFMPPELLRTLREISERHDNLRVLDFSSEADQLISRADRVIAMGGYNTVCSLLTFQKPALLVPRVFPRSEQWIRAQRLQHLGLLDVLHPNDLSPAAITQWLREESLQPAKASDVIDLNGLASIQKRCRALVNKEPRNQSSPSRELA